MTSKRIFIQLLLKVIFLDKFDINFALIKNIMESIDFQVDYNAHVGLKWIHTNFLINILSHYTNYTL